MTQPVIIGDATLYLGRAEDILPTLARVDACVTDPPYGIGIARRGTLGSENHAPVRDYGKSDWDDAPAAQNVIDHLCAASDWQIIFGGNYFTLPPSSCWLVWDKQNTGDYADCELAWTNLQKAVRRVYWRWNGMIRQGNEERWHPTQKPLGVMRWCLEQLPPVESILDAYMGSGTTGVAAIKAGKRFIGIEREAKYFDVAAKRISDAIREPDMFIAPQLKPTQEALI